MFRLCYLQLGDRIGENVVVTKISGSNAADAADVTGIGTGLGKTQKSFAPVLLNVLDMFCEIRGLPMTSPPKTTAGQN